MKNFKIKLLAIIIFTLLMMTICTISNAGVEMKPGTTTYTKISVSDSYQLCYNLRNADSTLGNNSLDPHLTLNKDWSAVAYLGASTYGGVRNATGSAVDVDGTSYNSTTGNITGVMNFGTTATQTSSITNGRSNDNNKNLVINKDTKYVENLTTDNVNGYALTETGGWYSSQVQYSTTSSSVNMVRSNIFGYGNSSIGSYSVNSGGSSGIVTFRPVIWN